MTTLDGRTHTRTGHDDGAVPPWVVRETEPDAASSPASGGPPLRLAGTDTVGETRSRVPPEVRSLLRDLRSHVEGEVRFDSASLAAYSTDASNYRQVPVGVVVPRTLDDVVATVNICREHGVPITHRGGGTTLAGQTAMWR